LGNPAPPPPAPSRTIVYVDGFNLYYAIKTTGHVFGSRYGKAVKLKWAAVDSNHLRPR